MSELLKEKILETWKVSDQINMLVGLDTTSDEHLPHQLELAFSEFKEGALAIKEGDIKGCYDSISDIHVTLPTCAMMYAGNKSLLDGTYDYELNVDKKDFNELLHEAQHYLLSKKYGVHHFQSAVDVACDMAAAKDINHDKMIAYFDAVNTSNLLKFPEVGSVDPEWECDNIESQGRYTEVYFEEGELLGKKVYIFKSKYDKKNNERYPNGKYLKPSTFKEPEELL